MLKTTFRGLWSHKRRLVSTVIAIVLGVAFMAGTLVLTSTINKIFDDLFANTNQNTDAVIRGDVLFKDQQSGTVRAKLPDSLVAKVAAVDGVADAVGTKSSIAFTLLDPAGEAMGGQGPPTFVNSWTTDPKLNAFKVVEGQAPEELGQAVIDKATADAGPFKVGDTLDLIGPKGREELKLVGITRFGDADSAGGTINIATTLEQAQALTNDPGRLDTIEVRGDGSLSPEQVVTNLKDADLAPDLSIVTGRAAAQEQANEIKDAFSFFSTILLVFAAIALFVGMFIISNTFGILIAQRTKELALLRAIGAGRGQVLTSVLVEAGIVGLIAAILGFFAGVALAFLAFAGLKAGGLDLPSTSLSITPSTAIAAIVVGLVVTAASAIVPAVRATRVPPIAALRDDAIDNSGRSKGRSILGLLMLIGGGLLITPAFEAEPPSSALPGIGLGLGLILGSVLVLGPVIAKPLSRLVGLPLPAIKGVTGRLARENAMRSPRRTASTASALIIGVTLVGFITVFAASAQESISNTVSGGFQGEYIIQPANLNGNLSGLPPATTDELRAVEGVDTVASVAVTIGTAKIDNATGPERNASGQIAGIDPADFTKVFKTTMDEGTLDPLGADQMVVDSQLAKSKDIELGSKITITTVDDKTATYEVSGISDDLAVLSLYGFQFVTSDAGFAKLSTAPTNFLVGISLDPGTSASAMRSELKAPIADYPTMKLQDREQFTGTLVAQIKALLNVIYGLLAVSIVIALIGIANTLSLSINERTRELGLLRAMGMSRRQLRSMVRWEAVIVALMGTGLGVILGLGLSWILVKGLSSQGIDTFKVPVTGLVIEVIFGAGLGILASFNPARRAAKLNVLDAIASE